MTSVVSGVNLALSECIGKRLAARVALEELDLD